MKTRFSTFSFNIIKVALTIAALGLFTCFLSYFYASKNGAIHRQRYYEQKEDVDVLFMGTSHAYAGYQPMVLYSDYGISAFNLATAGERFAVNYYSLLDAFEHHVPKVCVIDCHGFEYGDEKNDHEVPTRCHGVFDGMPLSPLKVKAVTDVLSDRPDTWIEYFVPLYYYHNRWTELEKQDFEDPVLNNYGKGGRVFYGVAGKEAVKPEVIPQEEYEWMDDYSTEYAEKIVQLCAQKGVDVHFICIPFPCSTETQLVLNRAQKLAEDYDNCYYVNLMNHVDEMDFDYEVDMADPGSHVNTTGGRKVTDYIGRYLSGMYELEDHRADDMDSVWNRDYVYYTTYLDDLRDKCQSYFEYIDMVWTPDYSMEVYVSDMAKADPDGVLKRLLEKDMSISVPAQGSYYCSNMGQEAEELAGKALEDTPLGKERGASGDALVTVAVRNNLTGELVEVTNWSETGRLE